MFTAGQTLISILRRGKGLSCIYGIAGGRPRPLQRRATLQLLGGAAPRCIDLRCSVQLFRRRLVGVPRGSRSSDLCLQVFGTELPELVLCFGSPVSTVRILVPSKPFQAAAQAADPHITPRSCLTLDTAAACSVAAGSATGSVLTTSKRGLYR